eukprot:8365981-Karenia_brevis.AAC.1
MNLHPALSRTITNRRKLRTGPVKSRSSGMKAPSFFCRAAIWKPNSKPPKPRFMHGWPMPMTLKLVIMEEQRIPLA